MGLSTVLSAGWSPRLTELVSLSPGVETITVYEEILRQARYQLRHGAALYARKFRLSCSEMNGRYSSNEFIVEVLGESLLFLGHLLCARSQDVLTSDRWLMDKDFVALTIPRPMNRWQRRRCGVIVMCGER